MLVVIDKLSKVTKSHFHSFNNENHSTECDHLNKICEVNLKSRKDVLKAIED